MKHVPAFIVVLFLFALQSVHANDFYDVLSQGEPVEHVPEEDERVVAQRVAVEEQTRLAGELIKANTSLNFVIRIKNANPGSTPRTIDLYRTFTSINVFDGKSAFVRAHAWSADGLRRNETAEKWTADGFSKTLGEVLFNQRPSVNWLNLNVCIYYGRWLPSYVGCNHLSSKDFIELIIGKETSKRLDVRSDSAETFDVTVETADEIFFWSSILPDCLNPRNNTDVDGTPNNKNYDKKRAYIENEDKFYKCDASKGWIIES